jgi:hypothetical protein
MMQPRQKANMRERSAMPALTDKHMHPAFESDMSSRPSLTRTVWLPHRHCVKHLARERTQMSTACQQ